jgi:ribosomal protein S12 methylthiotransferase accessory factor
MGEAELPWEEYEEALFDVYGKERVEQALRIIEGEEFMIDVTLHQDYHNMLKLYDRLDVKKALMIAKN